MATHLILLCHGATRAMRDGLFASHADSLDEGGHRKLGQFRLPGRRPDLIQTSGALAARQTAEYFGQTAEIEEAIGDMDAGPWAGRSIADLLADDPAAIEAWLSDPAGGAPGGESMEAVMGRVRLWLDRMASTELRIVAVSHAAVLRASVAILLDARPASALNIDIKPLMSVRMSFNRRWRLQEICAG